MKPCPACATRWVDQASIATGLRLAEPERQRLIAGLLAHRHLILSGPSGIGKQRFAQALSLAVALGRTDHICSLQGHPWWAASTGDVTRYVELQTDFSLWRLLNFVDPLLAAREAGATLAQENVYVTCIRQMSPVEIELYFVEFAQWLVRQGLETRAPTSVRLVGTFDSERPPVFDATVQRFAALVHLDRAALVPVGSALKM